MKAVVPYFLTAFLMIAIAGMVVGGFNTILGVFLEDRRITGIGWGILLCSVALWSVWLLWNTLWTERRGR